MSELKNTPWTVVEQDTPQGITGIYEVEDYLGNVVAASITDRPTAKAIASLPDTLKRLKELEEVIKTQSYQDLYREGSPTVIEVKHLKTALENETI